MRSGRGGRGGGLGGAKCGASLSDGAGDGTLLLGDAGSGAKGSRPPRVAEFCEGSTRGSHR